MVSTDQCAPPPLPPNPNPLPLSGFCIGMYSKWSWNGVCSFLLQVSLFLHFKRIIPALRRLQCALRHAGVALFVHATLSQGNHLVNHLFRVRHCRCVHVPVRPGVTECLCVLASVCVCVCVCAGLLCRRDRGLAQGCR